MKKMTDRNSRVLIVDDDVLKLIDIERSLAGCGINRVETANNQEDAWDIICRNAGTVNEIDIIVSDMQYPISGGEDIDVEAGTKLIDRLRDNDISVAVIICSSIDYNIPDIAGTVWYSDLRDLDADFRAILGELWTIKPE